MQLELIYYYRCSKKLKDRLIYIDKFKKILKQEIESNFNSFYIEFPYLLKSDSEFYFKDWKRSITFDSNNVEGYLKIFNDNIFWINNKLIDLEVQPKSSIYSIKKHLVRDNNVFENQSIESEHLMVELVVEKEKCNKESTIFIFRKILRILNKIILKLQNNNFTVENNLLFENFKIIEFSKFNKKFPFRSFEEKMGQFFSEEQSLAILFDEKNYKFNDFDFFDIVQNDLSNTLYFWKFNRNSMTKNVLIKVAERPTSNVIKKQVKHVDVNLVSDNILNKYEKNNVYSYLIDLDLSAIFSALFSDFAIAESSNFPGHEKLEKEYYNSKIKII